MDLDLKLQNLKVFLETLSIDIKNIELITRERSYYESGVEVRPYPSYPKHIEIRSIRVPMLCIHVATTENYQSLGFKDGTKGNFDSTYPKTNDIRKRWCSLISEENQIANYHDDHMYVIFRNYPQQEIVSAILKNENQEQLSSMIDAMEVIKPEWVSTHSNLRGSVTGFRVKYKNEQDYVTALSNEEFELISLKILQFIQLRTPHVGEDEVSNFLEILFVHPDMTNHYEWYKIVNGTRVEGEIFVRGEKKNKIEAKP